MIDTIKDNYSVESSATVQKSKGRRMSAAKPGAVYKTNNRIKIVARRLKPIMHYSVN
jgi:hypothetical protein